ncbi:amidohydrolase [Xinfangfangia sp. D13-10-4-6]|uniref:amidohydrolase family protein n=1 Tax=Pseudogemmobacter hezensis TaxID=2737662 RepID=UPI001554EF9F|nr:amidohydrolase [Pseudogemmobacter hezensis]NPD16494.1 amidohydrolase [Pseudogemmobacter hezensis]
MIFDTHLHLVDRSRLRYPWLAGAGPLARDWSYEDYEASARRIGITDVLHMEVDVAPEDIDAETDFIRELMARPDSLIRGAISAARPESPDFAPWLERVDRKVVRGIRRILHESPDELSTRPVFRQNIRALGAAGLPFDICALARQLALMVDLVDAAPDTCFIIDHCGNPRIADREFDAWAADIRSLAARPHVNIKLSGICAYGGPDWVLADLQPYVDHVLDCFGPERLVWGSDSPVCTNHSSLAEWVAASQALLARCTDSERRAVFQANARRIWSVA